MHNSTITLVRLIRTMRDYKPKEFAVPSLKGLDEPVLEVGLHFEMCFQVPRSQFVRQCQFEQIGQKNRRLILELLSWEVWCCSVLVNLMCWIGGSLSQQVVMTRLEIDSRYLVLCQERHLGVSEGGLSRMLFDKIAFYTVAVRHATLGEGCFQICFLTTSRQESLEIAHPGGIRTRHYFDRAFPGLIQKPFSRLVGLLGIDHRKTRLAFLLFHHPNRDGSL